MSTTPPEPPADDHASQDSLDELRMSFGDHLDELRKRLIYALLGIVVMFMVTLYFGSNIILWLLTPLVNAQRQAGLTPMAVTSITSGFTTYIMVAFFAALILTLPWVLYHLWQFVAAGLYPDERKVILLIAPLSAFMATLGVGFLYYVMLPVGLFFFLSFTTSYPEAPPAETGGLSQGIALVNKWAVRLSGMPGWNAPVQPDMPTTAPAATQPMVTGEQASPASQDVSASLATLPMLTEDPAHPLPGQIWLKQPEGEIRVFLNQQIRKLNLGSNSIVAPLVQVGDYLTFMVFLTLGVVLAFQLPVIMLVLGWIGLVRATWLAKYRGHAMLVLLIIAAILTPPDPVTMMLLGIPMYLLFEMGLLLMRLANRRSRRLREYDQSQLAE